MSPKDEEVTSEELDLVEPEDARVPSPYPGDGQAGSDDTDWDGVQDPEAVDD